MVNTKGKVKNNLGVFICASIFTLLILLLSDMLYFNLYILIDIVFLGLANGIYWSYIFGKEKMNKITLILIICFTWPILAIIGTLLLLPTLVFDLGFVTVCFFRNLIKIGVDNATGQVMISEVRVFEKKKIVYGSLLFIFFITIFVLLFFLNVPLLVKLLLWLSCLILYIVLKNIINSKILTPLDYIIYDLCDSRQYYHIYKYLNNKYPKEYSILQNYVTSLKYDENDFSELKEILLKYKQYKKQVFYISSLIEIETNEKNCFDDAMYNKLWLFNLKMYKKSRNVEWEDNNKFLQIKKSIFQNKYLEALHICNTISSDNTKIFKVKKAFYKGVCLMYLNEGSKAKEEFEYVISEGNTLRMVSQAREYLDEIENGYLEE